MIGYGLPHFPMTRASSVDDSSGVVARLIGVLGSERVHTHPLDLLVFGKDAGVTPGEAAVVVLPESTDEVAAVVRVATAAGVPVVARGAGTGLAGGAVPTSACVLVVLTRMNEIFEVDEVGRTAWVGAGLVNEALSNAVADHGLLFAPDPASQQTATIGGNVGTNAGGPHCLAEGSTIAHVLGMEVVTGDGEVMMVGGAAPDPLGYDLRGLFVGSEGTLGIVTRVLVRLVEVPPQLETMLISFVDVSDAARAVSEVIAEGVVPAALELMDGPMIEAVENFVHAGLPVGPGAVLLAEVSGHSVGVAADAALVREIAVLNGATEIRVARDEDDRALLWKGRKAAFGAIAQSAPDYYLNDTVVPRTRFVDVLDEIYAIAERYELRLLNLIHAGDGNFHPIVSYDAAEAGMTEKVIDATHEMVRAAVAAGGTLSGEHGIGIEKRDLMPEVFSADDLDAQERIRDAFDPLRLLNPGKVLPEGSRCLDRPPT
ncbi:MAG: FAD-linked oxidase C-terminal domain-containing protein [Acidimicrobiia bacterium]|nr:FAD-linked oxidase C-terminal domain-containing protein [Acidimicrobiia bacterium]